MELQPSKILKRELARQSQDAIQRCFKLLRCIVLLCIFVLPCVAGCSTHAKRLAEPRNLFYAGQMDQCREQLTKLSKSHRGDRDVAMLDLAMVDLVGGDAKQAESRLRDVRDRFEYLEQDSLTEKTLSAWTDDQMRSYAGEDYERMLVYAFLSLSNLMHDGGDAEAYSLQLNEKRAQLINAAIEKSGPEAEKAYRPVSMGDYLRGVIRESNRRDYDDAAKAYARVVEWNPEVIPFQWDLNRVRTSVHSQPGMGVIYVFALVGRGPIKVEVAEQPTSDALLIADRIVSAVGPYSLPPTLAPIKIPDIQIPAIEIDNVGVAIDQKRLGPTQCITSVERMALDTYAANRSSIVARAVVRRVLKKASIVAAKKVAGTEGLTSFAMDAAGVAWEATESADTRCWGLLPREIQVMRIEVPAGSRNVTLHPLVRDRVSGLANTVSVHVNEGENTYVLACFPDSQTIGQIRSNR